MHVFIYNVKIFSYEIKIIKDKAQVIKNNFQVIRDEIHKLKNKAQVIENNFQAYKNKASVCRNNNNNNNNTQDKINNQIDLTNKIDKILSSINIKLSNNVKSIYESIHELKDEIYDDPWVRLVELNKIKHILDDASNVGWYDIYDKNRINNINIDIDKDKDNDG